MPFKKALAASTLAGVAASPAVAGFRPAAAALALAACFAVPGVAQAQATGAQVVHGQAGIVQQGANLVVTTQNGAGTNHSAINWQSFSVPAGSTTQFNQPSAASTSINRVLGNNPSSIFGTLSSNGKLVLVNPSGIAVGAGAVVDTAGFTASALRMTDADALAGRLVFGQDTLTSGAVQVNGRILARGGDIVLIGPNVQVGADAVVQSPNGATVLAAGQKVEVTGRGLEGIRLQLQAPSDQAVNLGTLQGDAVGLFAGQLKHSGLIQANAASAEGGRVLLKGVQEADIGGQITAARGNLGGQVLATASKVMLRSGAVIDVSGANGGGEALIGGGWQGHDARLSNASQTTAETGSTVRANATDSGNGGTVVLWSDGTTRTAADISARGGVNGGNGGQVETSGRGSLSIGEGKVDARAPRGQAGQWLIDPTTMTIEGGTGGAANTIYEDTIEAAGANVLIQATDAITASGTFTGADVVVPSGLNLTIQTTATGGGTGIDLTSSTHGAALEFKTSGGGNVQLSTGNTGQTLKASNISVAGTGSLTMNSLGPAEISNATLQTGGGAISIAGNGTTLGDGVKISKGIVNAGTGAVTLTGAAATGFFGVNIENSLGASQVSGGTVNVSGTAVTGNYGVRVDRSTVQASNGLTLGSTDSRVYLQGATLTATGGNLLVQAKGESAGAPFPNSLFIEDVSGTPSIINNSGAGTVTLQGELTSHANSAGSPSGMLIRTSTVSSAGGAISLTGATGTSGFVENTSGVRLNSGAIITSSGPISVTGTAGATSNLNSRGIEANAGSTISSSGGSVTINGTLNNPSAAAGTGLLINGKVTSSGLMMLTGVATVGNGAGTGLEIGPTAFLLAGTSGLTASGSVSSSTTATALVAASVSGGITSTGAISINGAVSAPSASGATGVAMNGGSVTAAGSMITVTGSGVPAPAPASSYDVSLTGTTLTSGGGEIKLVGDRMNVASGINSSTGRTMFVPVTTSRAVTLGGSSETAALNLSSTELNQVTASGIVVGGSLYTGGISVGNTGGTINPSGTNSLSLINSNGSGSISQSAAFTIAKLNADAASVNLANPSNSFTEISGRAYGTGNYIVRNGATANLSIGTVDSILGIENTGTGYVQVITGGPLTQTQRVLAPTFKSTSTDGLTLNNVSNQIASFDLSNTAGDIIIKNGVATTLTNVANFDSSPMPPARFIQIDNTGTVTVLSVASPSLETGLTFTSAAIGIKSTQGIVSSGGGTHIAATAGGSVYLDAANGSVGASDTSRLKIDGTGPIVAAAAGAGNMANLGLLGATVNLNKVTAPGTVDLAGSGTNALTITDITSTSANVLLSSLSTATVNGKVDATAGTVNIVAGSTITVQPAPGNTADAEINAGGGSVNLSTTAGNVNVLASTTRGAKIIGTSGAAAPGCATQAVCITAGGGGAVNVTANGANSAGIGSTSGNIGINGGSLVLTAGTTADALVQTAGAIDVLPGTCTGCNLLPFGSTPLGNTTPQAGLLASNRYLKVIAGADSGSVASTGGTVNLLANDAVDTMNGTLSSAPATPALVTISLVAPPPGVTVLGGTSIDVPAGTPAGSYSFSYNSCAVADANNCVTGTISLNKAAAPSPSPSPSPSPTPPAPTPTPTPTPPAPTPPAPTPPAPSPTPTPAPAPTPTPAPPAPTPPAPTPPAPAPSSGDVRVDAIVSVLRGTEDNTEVVKQVKLALAEQDDKLATFAKLLIKAAADQEGDTSTGTGKKVKKTDTIQGEPPRCDKT